MLTHLHMNTFDWVMLGILVSGTLIGIRVLWEKLNDEDDRYHGDI